MSNLTIGKIANNSVTLVLSSQTTAVSPVEVHADSAGNPNHADFSLTLPNLVGFPHKSRCLCHIESITAVVSPALSPGVGVIGVVIEGMAPHKVFRNGGEHGYVGFLTLKSSAVSDDDDNTDVSMCGETFTASGDIITNGVMCQSPFGKRIRVRCYNATTHTLLTGVAGNVFLTGQPVVLKLKLLFLDNDDMKDF